MKYVKIKAEGYNEALIELRKQHGDEAIPISHKYVKEGGFFGSKIFAKDVVELTAAIHDRKRYQAPKTEKKSLFDTKVGGDILPELMNNRTKENDERNNGNLDDVLNNLNSLRSNMQNDSQKDSNRKVDMKQNIKVDVEKERNLEKFEKEFEDIKAALEKLTSEKLQKQENEVKKENEHLIEFRTVLKNNDFDDQECDEMIKNVKNSISRDDLEDKYKIQKSLKDLVKSKIVTSGEVNVSSGGKKVIMLVGPTGVGKTTSLAKLGANFALRDNKKVAFVTIDTYRIAATEQLKKYAEIMKIPVHVVNDQKEFKTVISKEKADIILVDTSGRSHKNKMKISEIKSYADQVDFSFEKILCVSAATKKADLKDIFASFEALNPDNIIITKVDETSFVGNVIDVADKYNKPVSYISNGQEVPTDICVADKDKLADMIIP